MNRRGWLCLLLAGAMGIAVGAPAKSEKKSSSDSGSKGRAASAEASSAMAGKSLGVAGFDEQTMAGMIFDLTNRERRKAGLQEFTSNRALAQSARQHSYDMATRGYFAHKSKGFFNRTDPRDRVEATGYNPGMVAENIAMIPTYTGQVIRMASNGARSVDTQYQSYNAAAEMAMEKWMNSPGHRANILNPTLRSLGVGVAVGVKDNVPYVYMTQNFGG